MTIEDLLEALETIAMTTGVQIPVVDGSGLAILEVRLEYGIVRLVTRTDTEEKA